MVTRYQLPYAMTRHIFTVHYDTQMSWVRNKRRRIGGSDLAGQELPADAWDVLLARAERVWPD